MVGSGDRGQALTFEAVISGIILLAAIGFALQVTGVTPLSPSTSSQHVENQIQATGEGALDASYESGDLEEAVLFWKPNASFHNASTGENYYQGRAPATFENGFSLGLIEGLDNIYGNRSIAYNIRIHYHNGSSLGDGEFDSQLLVEQGGPSDNAVSASRTVVLMDNDRLVHANGTAGQRLGSVPSGHFYVPDKSPGPIYNVLRVEVVAWRL